MQGFTANKIAEVLGVSKQAIMKRAKKEGWPHENGKNRAKRFLIEGLPGDIRARVIQRKESPYIKGMVLPTRGDLDLGQARALLAKFDGAPVWSRRKAEARGEVVEAFARFSEDRGQRTEVRGQRSEVKSLTEMKAAFINRYNIGNNHLGISPEVYGVITSISRASLDLWRSKKKVFGLAGLLDAATRGKPAGKITPEMADYIIGIKRAKIHTRPVRIYEYLKNKFGGPGVDLPHDATVRRFVTRWEKDNGSLVAFLKNPDKWRSDYQAAFGDASEKAEYFLHMIEFDNTPADVMCTDGRYTITGAIDIFTRKARAMVVPTSKSVAVAGLMRRIILDWGLFDVMITDNGKDYASKHIEAACGALSIEPHFTAPFTPEAKPHIERFFRSMSMSLFEELSGYIGHSVADRKDIESQKSFASRMFKKDQVIEVRMTAEELQAVLDTWTDKIYHQRKHSTLGMTPEQKAGESRQPVKKILDERVLDILLAPVGRPTVSKKGLKYQNGRYVAPELADFVKQKVQIRRDLSDAGTLYVFDSDSKFICIAKDASLEGITVEEAVEARNRQKKRVREQARALKSLAKEAGDPMGDLLEAKREASGQVFSFRREVEAESAAITEAEKALIEPSGENLFSRRDAEAQRKDEKSATLTADKVVPLRDEEMIFESRLERYKYLEAQGKIRTLTEREEGFIEGYEGSEEYYRIFVEPYK